jgi:hypothetical protein
MRFINAPAKFALALACKRPRERSYAFSFSFLGLFRPRANILIGLPGKTGKDSRQENAPS